MAAFMMLDGVMQRLALKMQGSSSANKALPSLDPSFEAARFILENFP